MLNYEKAKAILDEHPGLGLLLDPEVPGQMHICVRKKGKPGVFSIMLPNQPLPAPIEYQPAVPEIPPANPGDIHQLARPEVQARSSQSRLEEAEREEFIRAIEAADRHL